MATITRADGTVEDKGESMGEFKARQTAKRIKRTGLSSSEKASGYTEKEILDYYEGKTAEASRERALNQKAINESINPVKPKGSYEVTRADGTKLYRTSGTNAQGLYVNDVYAKVQEQNIINKVQDQYKVIPKTAKKVQTQDGEIYRNVVNRDGQKIVMDYKPGGLKEIKTYSKTLSSGESFFIPKTNKNNNQFVSTSPAPGFALSVGGDNGQKPSDSLARYSETLIERENRLNNLKNKVFDFLHIKGEDNAKWYNVKEIGKGVARVPFELASLPAFLYGRVNFTARAIFDQEGRKVLKQGFKDTPGAVRNVFITKDQDTGKYKLTAQNVVNIGLTAVSVKTIAKSPNNVGLKAYEKTAKTNIKVSGKGYQGTTVFKNEGKLIGRPYKELTVIKDGASKSTINYQGKTYVISRNAKGGGSYKIIRPKTRVSIQRKGVIPKKINLYKDTQVIKQGKFIDGNKPINFKTGRGVTTQDINFLNSQPLSKTYISYLEQLKTSSKASQTFKSGSQTLRFDASANVKVKADLSGVITKQKVNIKEVSFKDATAQITNKYVNPKISFSKKPVNPKDVVIKQFVKDGKGYITGGKEGVIIQPRHVLKGPKDAFVNIQGSITGGKGFNIYKGVTNKVNNYFWGRRITKAVEGKTPKPLKVKSLKSEPSPVKLNARTYSAREQAVNIKDGATITKSKYQSTPAPLNKQVVLTEQIISETAPSYNVPFQTRAPKIQYATANFELLNSPIGNIKPVPLVPTIKINEKSLSYEKPTQLNNFVNGPGEQVKFYRSSRPANIIKQVQNQKPLLNLRAGFSAGTNQNFRPKNVIEQIQNETQVSAQIQRPSQKTRQEQVFNSVFSSFKARPSVPQLPRFNNLNFPKPLILPRPSFNVEAPQGFNVFTRIKGVFKQANIKPLSKTDALNFGAFKVGNTSQATFKIEQAGTSAQDVFKQQVSFKDFYEKDGLYIEKKERRIKSFGELKEITFKGIRANKTKNIFGGKK